MNFIALNVIAANYDKFMNNELDFDQPVLFPELAKADSKINDSLIVKPL